MIKHTNITFDKQNKKFHKWTLIINDANVLVRASVGIIGFTLRLLHGIEQKTFLYADKTKNKLTTRETKRRNGTLFVR